MGSRIGTKNYVDEMDAAVQVVVRRRIKTKLFNIYDKVNCLEQPLPQLHVH